MTGRERTAGDVRPGADGEATEESIERQIEALRDDIGGIVGELDRRRHEALDLRLQMRRHAGAFVLIGVVALVVGIGGYRWWAAAQRRRELPVERLRTLAQALAMVSREPDRLVRAMEDRPQRGEVAMKALGTVAGAAGKRLVAG